MTLVKYCDNVTATELTEVESRTEITTMHTMSYMKKWLIMIPVGTQLIFK